MSQFLWYDLETFGRDPRRSRIAQFGAIRTDANLDPVEDPVMLFCRPADDLLPSPGACLITGITPQQARAEGLPEAEFAARIHEEMSRPHTCVAGYNSFRFDDEFIRNLFYRDFLDPYEREWRNGNSRWDLIDVMRMAQALRPDGVTWPRREDGAPSFKLEQLAAANGLLHTRAHDALSDVEATIALARRLREAQPKLFDYAFGLRDKKRVASLLDYVNMTPVLHISQRYPATHGCGKLVLPLCPHPQVANQIIVCDLSDDPEPLIELPADEIIDRLYTPRADLPEGVIRVGLKQVHLNRAPVLIELRHLSDAQRAVFGIDLDRELAHASRLRESPGLVDKVRKVFGRARPTEDSLDSELALYAGFPDPHDKRLFSEVRRQRDRAPDRGVFGFHDPRYEELAFRYRARNFPDALSLAEQERWHAYRAHRLSAGSDLSEYDLASYRAEIASLRAQPNLSSEGHRILDALEDWGRDVEASL
ncbi:exodeoxyribonuclease I [Xanthomonadaceae bacterium XH05]|nr:exodeoxyribonuclease I [Xanthomonadaceae bacterium XH05]